MGSSRILYTPPEFRNKKRGFFKKAFSFFGLAILAILLIAGTVYIFRMPKWQIRNIEISGLETLKSEEIIVGVNEFLKGTYLGLIPKGSALVLESEAVGRYLKDVFPRIAEAEVSKAMPDSLKIFVKEREFFGILCNDLFLPGFLGTTTSADLRNPSPSQILPGKIWEGKPQCAYLDNTGFAYEDGPSSSGTLILKISTDLEEIKIPLQVFDRKLIDEMVLLRQRLGEILGISVLGYEFLFRVSTEIKVLASDGFKIIFSREENWENSFRVLKKVLDEEIKEKKEDLEYIDLRFGNKVFYKFSE